MDEIYIKVKDQWKYYPLAVNKFGNIINFLLYKHRDEKVIIPSSTR
ncbi:DDE-type integrase/transposase/recombinase [Candidatus Enterovibrio escicola]